MSPKLIALLLISSSLKFFLNFSHILFLSLVGLSVAALRNHPGSLTVGICLSGAVAAVVTLQIARSLETLEPLHRQRLRAQLLEKYTPAQAAITFALAYFTVLVAGSIVLLALIGSWEALTVTIIGNGLAWAFAQFFVQVTTKPTKHETKKTRRRLRPIRNMAVDAIPLIAFILGLALFPRLLGLHAIPIFLILRHTSRQVFQITLQSGMHKVLRAFD